MPLLEDLKRTVEVLTGLYRPDARQAAGLVRPRKPRAHRFRDDGETPNNPRLPFVHYRTAVRLDPAFAGSGGRLPLLAVLR